MSTPTQSPVDPQILQIASLTDLPKQPITMIPTQNFMGVQIQQLKSQGVPPTVSNQSQLNVTRTLLSGGTYQYRVQYSKPAGQTNYQSTNIVLRSPSGSIQTVGSGNNNKPITFYVSPSNIPTSISLQHVNSNGPASNPSFGSGFSARLPYRS